MLDKKTTDELISQRLLWLRTSILQMTQTELAFALHVTHQHIISRYERGFFKPGLTRCMKLIELAAKHGKKIDMAWLRPDLHQLNQPIRKGKNEIEINDATLDALM